MTAKKKAAPGDSLMMQATAQHPGRRPRIWIAGRIQCDDESCPCPSTEIARGQFNLAGLEEKVLAHRAEWCRE